jgi:hypothetical protein
MTDIQINNPFTKARELAVKLAADNYRMRRSTGVENVR